MAQRQYIGPRFVLKIYENSVHADSAEWEANTAYEPLIMVTYNNSSYVSRKEVPATVGNPALNPTYWCVMGSYNGQIANLQSQIDSLKDTFYIVTPDMDIADIKNAVETYNNIYFSEGTYQYDLLSQSDSFVKARDNMNIWIDGTLKLKPNAFEGGCIVDLTDVHNVSVFGHGTLQGDKHSHTGSTGEWQPCLNINHSDNVHISGITCKEAWGDGIMILETGLTEESTNVHIDNVICDDNRRSGISVAGAIGLWITNSKFTRTGGTAPQAGIAIEGNTVNETLDRIYVIGCDSYNNAGAAAYASTYSDGTISFEGCNFEASGNKTAFGFGCLDANCKVHFNLRDCEITSQQGFDASLNQYSSFDVENVTFNKLGKIYTGNDAKSYVIGCVNNPYISGVIKNSILKCVVKDSAITNGLFGFVSSDYNIVSDSVFDFELCGTSVIDSALYRQFNKANTLINIKSDTTKEFSSADEALQSNPNMIYSDNSYAAGLGIINLHQKGGLVGTKYTIKNTSATHNLELYTKSDDNITDYSRVCGVDTHALLPGNVMTVEKLGTDDILISFFNAQT